MTREISSKDGQRLWGLSRGWRHAGIVLAAAAVLAFPNAGEAVITFNFNYTDAAGTGWNDATYGQERRDALMSAANTLGAYFNTTATIGYTVTSITNPNTNTLASASSDAYGSLTSGFAPTVVEYKLQSGYSGPVSYTDGAIEWNFGKPWGISSVATNQYDFTSTAMHELLHSFGFVSGIESNGTGLKKNASGQPDVWYVFDRYLATATGSFLIDTNTFGFNTSLIGTLTGGAAALRFDGAAAALTFTNGVPIYTPATWEEGSSGSHTDDLTFNGSSYSNLMMNAASDMGQGIRTLSVYEKAILTDIGYTIVPEPGSVTLCVMGAMTVLFFHRHRRKTGGT